jgi:hypothetical protein
MQEELNIDLFFIFEACNRFCAHVLIIGMHV